MCGVCGYTGPSLPGVLARMMEAIRHRGPDSGGVFETGDLHLGCRRLRVLDIDGGDQPIFNEDGSVVVVYNGEIYNFRELRRDLEDRGHRFKTMCDTEILVHLYEEHGTDCPRYLNGMFAFALWDSARQRLFLARDPVGIKPLAYCWSRGTLVFGSEAKSLLHHPAVERQLDPDALHLLLNVRFIPGPATLFKNIRQVPPGTGLVWERGLLREVRYHSWRFEGGADVSPEEAAEGFLEHLQRAVRRQMIADVPLGVFLSGGLDSSAILTASSSSDAPEAIKTFSLGFNEPTDELDDARLMAQHCGVDHRETRLSARPLELFPRIVYYAEAPKVNASQGYYLSRFARDEVTVALSGLGGDELYYGYELYRYLWPGRWLIDGPLSRWFRSLSPLCDWLASGIDRFGGPGRENTRRAMELLASGRDPIRYYLTLRNGWDLRPAAARKIYTHEWRERVHQSTRAAFEGLFDRADLPFAEQVQWAEFRGKMVDDFLLNEDRMSMANSLEVRLPLLDLEMIDFAFSLPFFVKHENRRLKPVMRQALAPRLPDSILKKKKRGFSFDSYEQFRKDLRDLCRRELTPRFLLEQGIFRPDFVGEVIEAPPSPRLRWHYFMIWQILGLKFWQEIFLEGREWQEIEDRIKMQAGCQEGGRS